MRRKMLQSMGLGQIGVNAHVPAVLKAFESARALNLLLGVEVSPVKARQFRHAIDLYAMKMPSGPSGRNAAQPAALGFNFALVSLTVSAYAKGIR
mmetsp:Transcript_2813/g.4264  ORF Transcript_2813/g.4264 Transcript_2813/m.4264 type:complete len:95 (+) Transcript_2813:1229-1513(+)